MLARLSCINCAPSQPSRWRRRREATRSITYAWGKRSAQHSTQIIKPPKSTAPLQNQPLWTKVGLAVLSAAALLQLAKKVTSKGSLGSLESRGLIAEGGQATRSNDPFYSKMMRNVNTVQYDELTQDQIEAARRRRSQDRRNNEKIDLSKIQLPANHPFAVSKELSEEEEQLQMARLNVRRGMPLKDVNELKVRQGTRQQPS